MSKDTAKPTYTKVVTHKATVIRLSSQKNQYGSYCYALIKHSLPKGTQILGKDGREIFYSPSLKGDQGKEFELDLAVVPVTNSNTGEVVNRIVIARSDAEKSKDEQFEREVQQDSKEARAFGITKQQLGKSYFAAKYAAKFGGKPVVAEEQDANA
jgi:hypothetical protein